MFEIEWPDELGQEWMNEWNLKMCIGAYCMFPTDNITVKTIRIGE